MAPSPTIRRLLKETAELSSSSPNPTPAFHAAPVSDSDLHEWHFTLLGPPSPSPYAGGLYHGRITLPPTYPLKPPNFRFLTPSGRFEVNREICLSISGFHEETWMPAWGVRTALTALRTFMAEPGSAGQVGGLEAPADVRKRLAKESRDWRCGMGCGGKSNIDTMREWWGLCREKGMKVDEEGTGESTEMELLPEGLNLEARGKSDKGKEKEVEGTTELEQQSTSTSEQTALQPLSPKPRLPPTDSSNLRLPSSPIPHAPTPTPESAQSHAESYLSTSDLNNNEPRHRRPMMSVHAPPVAAASAALNNAAPLQRQRERENPPTVTIDRAIAFVFGLLIFVVLKKIFYPGGTMDGGTGYVDGGQGRAGGFYMEREI